MIYTLTLNPALDREYTVSSLEFDSVSRAVASRLDYGGKGFNVSRLVKGMTMSSTAVAFLGGNSGKLLNDGLKSLDIDTDIVWVPGETRTNISIVTESHDHYIKINEKGPWVDEAKQQELLDKVASLARKGDWWVLAGSLPPGISDDFYASILNCINEQKARSPRYSWRSSSTRLCCKSIPRKTQS